MSCAYCGQAEVSEGDRCPACGTIAVTEEALDVLLELRMESIGEQDDDDEGGGVMAFVEDESATADSRPEIESAPPIFRDPVHDPLDPDLMDPGAGRDFGSHDEVASDRDDESAPVAGSVLPRRARTGLGPTWGPRDHPPAVVAPAPPLPLEAPAGAPAQRRSGTGLPAPAAATVAAKKLTDASDPPVPPPPVPTRTSHPRVRRWLGRGAERDALPDSSPEAEPVPAPVANPAFPGAPAGILDGVEAEADDGSGPVDPAGVEEALGRLSPGARRVAAASMMVASAVLEQGERVAAVVQGDHQRRSCVAVLTDRRILVVDERPWSPVVRSFPLGPQLGVHGWQDDRRASLVFVRDGVGVLVSDISDRPLARDLARRARVACGLPPDGAAPPG